MSDEIVVERRASGVAVVILNRPQAMNALSATLRAALYEVMVTLRDDENVRVIVLTGAGERAFTAGLDLKELGAGSAGLAVATDADPRSNPVRAVESCGKPVIGAINGVAITGGFELALACDVLIASENARFADTHALVGIMPGWGLSQKLQRIVGAARAREMSFTGRFIDAERALRVNLVSAVVPDEALESAAQLYVDEMLATTPLGLRLTKDAINFAIDAPSMDAAMAMEDRQQILTSQTADHQEAISARVAKRAPDYRDC